LRLFENVYAPENPFDAFKVGGSVPRSLLAFDGRVIWGLCIADFLEADHDA
jgi:hypothetical protein